MKKRSIKSWAEEDQPREKLLQKGVSALSNAELLSILIGKGTVQHSALDIGKQILVRVNHDLMHLARLNVQDLVQFKGIGNTKAVTLVAAFELARRRKGIQKPKIKTAQDAYEHFKPYLSDLYREEFWMLCLNRQLQILQTIQISKGGLNATMVDIRLLFKAALENFSTSILLCHNHPSGQLHPSKQDIQLTQKIKSAAVYLDIEVADHLIFTDNGYYSFAENGLL